jgi:ryanodine receptor 2
MNTYTPTPIDTTAVAVPADLTALQEQLAEHVHDIWARERIAKGWTVGPRNDEKKTNPCLVPYSDLPEGEKIYDRNTALETIKAILALGYRIEKQP